MREVISFLIKGFQTYSGSNRIWFLLPPALVYLLIFGGKEARRTVIWPLLGMLLTVFNPLVCSILIKKATFNSRYHRFFWMVLFYLVIGYAGIHLIFRFQEKRIRLLVGAVICAAVLFLGRPVFIGKNTYRYVPAQTFEFAPKDHVQLSRILHSENQKKPRVLFDVSLVLTYRAYDPDVSSVMTRNHLEKITTHSRENFLKLGMKPSLTSLFLVCYYSDLTVPYEEFIDGCAVRKVDYLVIQKGAPANDYVRDAGFQEIGESDHYRVWKNVYRFGGDSQGISPGISPEDESEDDADDYSADD